MMKIALLVSGIFLTFLPLYGQKEYARIYRYDTYQQDWAKVKSICGTFGFIDRSGKIIVEPVYKSIAAFGEHHPELAVVQSVSGFYGCIDKTGREIIPTIYERRFLITNIRSLYQKAATP